MKNILVLILLFFSISASAVKKTVYVYFEMGMDYITIRLKNGTMKTLTAKDGDRYEHFDDYYEFDKSLIEPTIVSGGISTSFRCVHGRIRFVSSPSAADYVARKVNQPQHADVEVTFVNNAGDANNCGEWFITKGDADYTVYLASPGELPEPDFTVYFNR